MGDITGVRWGGAAEFAEEAARASTGGGGKRKPAVKGAGADGIRLTANDAWLQQNSLHYISIGYKLL